MREQSTYANDVVRSRATSEFTKRESVTFQGSLLVQKYISGAMRSTDQTCLMSTRLSLCLILHDAQHTIVPERNQTCDLLTHILDGEDTEVHGC